VIPVKADVVQHFAAGAAPGTRRRSRHRSAREEFGAPWPAHYDRMMKHAAVLLVLVVGCRFDLPEVPCGNGELDPREECDDGNTTNGDACDSNCTTPRCGNGVVTEGEECDFGPNNFGNHDVCLLNCRLAKCGDGYEWIGGEQCDDGNLDDSDDCLSTCRLSTCGDGYVNLRTEACDDGNNDTCGTCKGLPGSGWGPDETSSGPCLTEQS